MKRIDTTNRAANLFGAGKDGFQDGDPTMGVLATQLNAAFFNNLQEEVASVIEDAGIALDGAVHTQLKAAIAAKIATAVSTVETYTDTAKAAAIATSEGYTNSVVAGAIATVEGYTDTAKAAAIASADSYTDTAKAAAIATAAATAAADEAAAIAASRLGMTGTSKSNFTPTSSGVYPVPLTFTAPCNGNVLAHGICNQTTVQPAAGTMQVDINGTANTDLSALPMSQVVDLHVNAGDSVTVTATYGAGAAGGGWSSMSVTVGYIFVPAA